MTLKIKLNHIILALAVIMLLFSTNAVAIAQAGDPGDKQPETISREITRTERAPMEVPGGPGYLMLNSFDFKPDNMTTQWAYFFGLELYNPGSSNGSYLAPVHLPNGAIVTQVVVYYFDLSSFNMSLIFSRIRPDTNGDTLEDLAVIIPTLNGYSYATDTSIDYDQIDLSNYSYFLELILPGGAGSDLSLIQVRIDYDYPTFLPTVLK